MTHRLNTPAEVMLAQADENLRRPLPMFLGQSAHISKAVIVGGGPSINEQLPEIRKRYGRAIFFAVNGSHDWLLDHGMTPSVHVILDSRQENVRFVQRPQKKTTYLIAAQCHPDVFEALKGYDVVMWVAGMEGMENLSERHPKPVILIGGGGTVGLKTMCLAYVWGFRKIDLFGFDSCYSQGQHHAYPQDLNDGEASIEVNGFTCAPWMKRQAEDFQQDAARLQKLGCSIKVHGKGLIHGPNH